MLIDSPLLNALFPIVDASPVLLQSPSYVPLYISFIPPVSVVLTIFQQKLLNATLLLSTSPL